MVEHYSLTEFAILFYFSARNTQFSEYWDKVINLSLLKVKKIFSLQNFFIKITKILLKFDLTKMAPKNLFFHIFRLHSSLNTK